MRKSISLELVLIFLFILLGFQSSKAFQNQNSIDSLKRSTAISKMNDGKNYYNNNNFDKAEILLLESKKILESLSEKDSSKLISIYNLLGNIYKNDGKSDLALSSYTTAIEMTTLTKGADHKSIGTIKENIGGLYVRLGDNEKAIKYLEEAYQIKIESYGPNHEKIADNHIELAILYRKNSQYKKALDYAKKALYIYTEKFGNNHSDVSIACSTIGTIYYRLNDLKSALTYFQKSSYVDKKLGNLKNVAYTNINIGNIYNSLNNYEKAIYHYNLGAETLENKFQNRFMPVVGTIYQNIGILYKKNNLPEKALESYKKVLAIYDSKQLKENTPQHAEICLNIGNLYADKGNYKKAKLYKKKAYEIYKESYGEENYNVAVCYYNLGRDYFNQKQDSIAMNYFQSSLKSLGCNSKKDIPYIISELEALKNLNLIIEILLRQQENSQMLLKHNLEYYLNIALEMILYKKFYSNDNLNIDGWTILVSHLYEKAILFYKKEFDNSGKYTYQINHIFEQKKSINLYKSFYKSGAKKIKRVSESILIKEDSLKTIISELEKTRFINKNNLNDRNKQDSVIAEYNNLLAEATISLDSFQNELKENYPNYYRLQYDTSLVSIKEIQKEFINNNQAILNFFVGETNIYSLLISKNKIHINETPKDFPLNELVQQMRNGIYKPFLGEYLSQNILDSLNLQYTTASYQLYKKLILPVKELLPDQSELIIIPDGVLGYIPFDALLTSPIENNDNPRDFPYLLKDYQTSIAYSATLLKEMRNKKHASIPDKNFLALAPSFESDNTDTLLLAARNIDLTNEKNRLGALLYNISEVERIQEIIGGDILTGTMATEAAFVEKASEYQILHLSTHGKANDKVGDYSFLAFYNTKDSIENEWLYNREIYELDLNADMVVLSACETGIGEMQRGEGIISLARGFSYAGAKSIITTLWSVNDQQTSEIMSYFYANIKDGKQSKDAALRKAKLEYIENSTSPEPYFWAAFIPIGDMSPIEISNQYPVWIWFIPFIFILLFFFYKK